jgi:uncharacterized protein YbaP (TraB family)
VIRALAALLGALWLAGCDVLPAEPAHDWPAPSPALWEVTVPGGDQRIWLFGTVHALPDGVEWRTPALEEALAGSDMLVVEIADLDDPSGPSLFEEMSHTPGQPPLTERVERAQRPALRALIDRAGYGDGDFLGRGPARCRPRPRW